eukprot:TRINITY_DN21698_c0_g3_i1.p1 TRINITY_DN21698_c0_g3~~TRINITY_DN21698_c0_g3_i1.p1  ORF type:complete len:1023 (+),score=250.68 TRINITY_DN21698_c0_g3_i1:83-3070(+)
MAIWPLAAAFLAAAGTVVVAAAAPAAADAVPLRQRWLADTSGDLSPWRVPGGLQVAEDESLRASLLLLQLSAQVASSSSAEERSRVGAPATDGAAALTTEEEVAASSGGEAAGEEADEVDPAEAEADRAAEAEAEEAERERAEELRTASPDAFTVGAAGDAGVDGDILEAESDGSYETTVVRSSASDAETPGVTETNRENGGAEADEGDMLLKRRDMSAGGSMDQATLDATTSPKNSKAWAYKALPMGSTMTAVNASPVAIDEPKYPIQIWPGTLQVQNEAKNGTLPVEVPYKSDLYKKLQALGRMVQGIAHSDAQAGNASQADVAEAKARLRQATQFLDLLVSTGKLKAVDIVDLSAVASRNQSAESMRKNGALLTATDISQFVWGFRGEDFGTRFNHDDSEKWLVSVQGDIVGSKHQFTNVEETFREAPGTVWPDGLVKYCFASDTSQRVRTVFKAAVEHYQKLTPFMQFEEVALLSNTDSAADWDAHRCDADHAIVVTSNIKLGCFSSLGMVSSATQQLNLQDPACSLFGTAVHELGHAIGLAHEHPRHPDDAKENKLGFIFKNRVFKGRTDYFQIDDSPLRLETYMLGEQQMKQLIQTYHDGNASALFLETDPLSVMHYDPYAFDKVYYKDRQMPMIRNADLERMGQRVGLSHYDVQHLARLYAKQTGASKPPAHEQNIGCINGYDAKSVLGAAKGVCSSLQFYVPWCSAKARLHCCECGGGVHIQCMDGESCPIVAINKQAYYWREELSFLLILFCIALVIVFAPRLPPIDLRALGKAAGVSRDLFFSEDMMVSADGALRRSSDRGSLPRIDEHAACDGDVSGDEGRRRMSRDEGWEPTGAFGKARAKAKSAFKALANWINAPVSGTFAERERPTQKKLSEQAIERFNNGFAPLGGGFSSGRDAPAAPLVGGEDHVEQPGCALNHGLRAKVNHAPAASEVPECIPTHRMHNSDSSDQEVRESDPDPFDKTLNQFSGTESSSEDDNANASS